jgi:hypothetical protein
MKRLLIALSLIVLSGCSNTDDKEITFDNLYEQKEDTVLSSKGEHKVTLGELKKQVFDKYVALEMNSYLETMLIMEKYHITEEDIQKKMDNFKGLSINKEQVRQFIILEEASTKIKLTDEELKKTFERIYKNSGKTFEEVKEDVIKTASIEKINKEKVNILTQNEDITYLNKEIEEFLKYSNETTRQEIRSN